MASWLNIHGFQLHPKIAVYVVKQFKNDSFCYGLYMTGMAKLTRISYTAVIKGYGSKTNNLRN